MNRHQSNMGPGFRQRMHVVPAAYKEGLNRLNRRDSVDCPNSAPTCNCSTGYSCIATARTKTTCATVSCVKDSTDSDGGGSVNPGLIAGPIVTILLLCSLTVWWYLRKKKARDLARLAELEERANRLEAAQHEVFSLNMRTPGITPTSVQFGRSFGPDAPESSSLLSSSAADNKGILTKPNNSRLLTVYTADSIHLDPTVKSPYGQSRTTAASADQDPFADGASFASGDGFSLLSQATNVIPIAYVPTSGSSSALANRRSFRPDYDLGFDLDREDLMAPTELDTVTSTQAASTKSSASSAPYAPSESDDTLSLMSGAGSFMSFNSNMFVLDTPKIATAQRLNLSQAASKIVPSPSFPHSIDQSPLLQKTSKLSPVRPTAIPKINIGRSPLSQAPVQNIDPNSASSASFPSIHSQSSSPSTPLVQPIQAETDIDPFADDSADTISLPSIHHRYDPRTLPTDFPQQPRFPSDTDDFRFSMGSLTAATSYGGSNASRPDSVASSQGSVMIKSATIVQVGQESQANGLFRSGSLLKGTQSHTEQQQEEEEQSKPDSMSRQGLSAGQQWSPEPILPPPDRGELFSSTSTSNFSPGASQRDTQYSQYSLGAFDFIPPAPSTCPPYPPSS